MYFQWQAGKGRPCFLYCGGAQVQFNSGGAQGSSTVGRYVPAQMLSAGMLEKGRACVVCGTLHTSAQHNMLPVTVRDLVFFYKQVTPAPLRWQPPAFAALARCFDMDDKTAIGAQPPPPSPALHHVTRCPPPTPFRP